MTDVCVFGSLEARADCSKAQSVKYLNFESELKRKKVLKLTDEGDSWLKCLLYFYSAYFYSLIIKESIFSRGIF